MTVNARCAVLLAMLCGCGGDDDDDRLRPATAEECPTGGTVLERDSGRNDIVCEGDVEDPQDGPIASCEGAQEQIAAALDRDIRRAWVGADAVACGPSGIESGAIEFGEGLTTPDRQQDLVTQYRNACTAVVAACSQ
jgi:hypothetical protein